MIFHLQASKRNLVLSLIPTGLMLSSVGFIMMFNPVDLSYLFHYILFSCLMLIVLIDYHYLLKGIVAPRFFKRTEPATFKRYEPPGIQEPPAPSFLLKKAQPIPQSPPPRVPENTADIKRRSNVMMQKIQLVLEDLENKAVRIEDLENKIQQQRHDTLASEKTPLPAPVIPLKEKTNAPVEKKDHISPISSEEKIILKERIENHLIIDEMDQVVAVIQRGIFRDISNTFAEFLGYERTELLQKNFFVFIAPKGFDDARKYYLNRLKGIATNSFKTVLLKKDQIEIPVEITITPTVYKGDSAEFIRIKEIKNES
jgi:PAS domain S-box-containing protein